MAAQFLLLHGANSSAVEMAPLVDALRGAGTIHVPDLVGHGGRPLPERLAIGEMAADVVAFMDAKGLERPIVIGYSLGAYLGLYLARHYPQRMAGLGALAPKYVFDAATIEHWSYLVSLERLGRPGNPRALELERHHAPQDWRAIAELNRRFFADLAREAPLSDDDLRAIRVPVAIASSDRDPIVPWAEAQALASLVPGSRLAMFFGAAHPLKAVPVLAVVRTWLPWFKELQ